MQIEAVPEGWFYALMQPDGSSVVALNTRRKFAVGDEPRRTLWQSACRHFTQMSGLTHNLLDARLEVWNSAASAARKIGGIDWCLLGDARFASDPLSGQGLHHAFDDASFAAERILSGSSATLATDLKERSVVDFERHSQATVALYEAEGRFQESLFWRGDMKEGRLSNGSPMLSH